MRPLDFSTAELKKGESQGEKCHATEHQIFFENFQRAFLWYACMLQFLNTKYTPFTQEILTRACTSARALLQTRDTIFTCRTNGLDRCGSVA